ncbi:MAG: hypothetical protein WBB98_17440 [Xanthobacteraceae bacterium]
MPQAIMLAPVAEAAIGTGLSLDAIVTGSFVSAAGLSAGTSIFATIGGSFLGKAAISVGLSIGVNYQSSARN